MNMQGLLALLISAAMSCGAMADTTSVPADADAALIGSATQTMEAEDAAAAPDTADSAGTADTSDAADTRVLATLRMPPIHRMRLTLRRCRRAGCRRYFGCA